MTTALAWTIPVLLATAAGCLAWSAFDGVAEVLARLAQRFRQSRRGYKLWQAYRLMREEADEAPSLRGARRGSLATLPLLFPLLVAAAGTVGAIAAADWLLSPALLLTGLWGGYMFRSYHRRGQHRQEADHSQTLLETFQSVFQVRLSIFAPLEEAVRVLPEGAVRAAVAEVISRYRMNRPVAECLLPLHDLRSPHLDEFVYILERIATSDLQVTNEMLTQLRTRVKKQRTREQRAKVTTARLRSLVRVLQGAMGAALVGTLSLGLWRAYWLETFGHRLLFIALVVGGIGMSAYFEGRVNALGEELS